MSCPKTVGRRRAMSYVAPQLSTAPTRGTCTPSLSLTQSSSHPFFSQLQPCADPRPHLSGALAERPSITGYEPKQLAEPQDHMHFTEDNQLAEHEIRADVDATRTGGMFFRVTQHGEVCTVDPPFFFEYVQYYLQLSVLFLRQSFRLR